jgi:hypothetical protein
MTAPSLALPARLEAGEGGAWVLMFAGYPPGRWTIWGDVFAGLAPLRIEGAVLDEMGALLGPVAVGPGSTIHVRVEPREGSPPPLLVASATYAGSPAHQRYAAETESWEIRLFGLEAGRYHVRAGPAALDREGPPTALDEVIEVDGRSEYERTVAPR